jgi:hypothetical protein
MTASGNRKGRSGQRRWDNVGKVNDAPLSQRCWDGAAVPQDCSIVPSGPWLLSLAKDEDRTEASSARDSTGSP